MGRVPPLLRTPDRKLRLTKIPAFPPIVLRLLNLLSSNDVDIRDLVALVSSDPAFSAHLLRVANSPLFGFSAQIDSLQSALVILGLRRVRSLTMTIATANHMKAALKVAELSRCWRHMLACAVLAEEMSRTCPELEDRAYSAGLLHDVGRLGLLLAYPAEYAAMLRDADRNALDLLECERESLGLDHCEAGRILAAQWNLPQDLQVVASRHHDPQQDCELDLLTLVHFGCKLADCLGFWVVKPLQPLTVEQIHAALPPLLRNRIHIDEEHWREILERRVQCFMDTGAALVEGVPGELEPPPLEDFNSHAETRSPAQPAAPDARELTPPGFDFAEIMAIGALIGSFLVTAVYFILTA